MGNASRAVRRHAAEKDRGEARTAAQGRAQQGAVAFAHPRETPFKPLLKARQHIARPGVAARVVLLQPEFRERRHERARQDVGGQHREYDGLGQGNEQKFGDAGQQEHGHEDDADRQGGHQCGQGDLVRAVENGRFHLLALLEVVVDVLDGDGGVVDQNAHRQGQASQGHDVDGLPQRGQAADRCQDGQRYGNGDDQGLLRQLPRNSRINKPVSAPAITASRMTPEIAARTNTD